MLRKALVLAAALFAAAVTPAAAQSTGVAGPESSGTVNVALTVRNDGSFALISGLTDRTLPTVAPGESSLTSSLICIYHSSPSVRFEAFTVGGAPDSSSPLLIANPAGDTLNFQLILGYDDVFGRSSLATTAGFTSTGVAFLNSTPDCSGPPNVELTLSVDVPADAAPGLYQGALVLRVGVE